MKNTPLLILSGITAICVIIATVMLLNRPEPFSPNNELIGDYLVEPFELDAISEVHISDAENEVTLKPSGSDWVVANRQDYPIDNTAELDQLIKSLVQFRIGLEVPAEEKHFAEIGLLEPGDKAQAEAYQEVRRKEGEENPADPRGLKIKVLGKDGADLVDLVLGEQFGSSASESPRGFVVRNLAGNAGVWKAFGSLARRTGEAESQSTDKRRGQITDPKAWLAYKFIEVEKIKSISLSAPNDPEFKPWTVTREDENGEFSTGDLKDDEEMDTAGTGAFKSLFNRMRFEDVLDAAPAEEKKDTDKARKAVIKTFEGFTYTFDLAPMKEEESTDEDAPPASPPNYIGTVSIEAEFPAAREKAEDETAEQAKAKDEAFQANQENLKFKLEREKAYEGRVFEFAQFSINSLNKTRDEIVKEKAPPSPEEDGTTTSPPASLPGLPGLPGNRPSAVTPPIPVPPVNP